MKKKILFLGMTFLCFMLGGCGLFDEKNISQEEAQKVAEGVTGREVTYVRTESDEDKKVIYYFFTDSEGIEFTISSSLNQGSIDDSAHFGPYYCVVRDKYQTGVSLSKREAIEEILEQYGLLENVTSGEETIYSSFPRDIRLTFYLGTPEENKLLLDKLADAGAEIDALLDMHYNINYDEEMGDKYYSYESGNDSTSRFSYVIELMKKTENRGDIRHDRAEIDFSLSDEERWTKESMYEALCEKLDGTEVAE